MKIACLNSSIMAGVTRGILVGSLGVVLSWMTGTVGCVTVNVNFPESTVQKATDDYVEQLYKMKKKTDSDTTQSLQIPGQIPAQIPVQKSFSLLFATAEAADYTLKMDSPKIKQIQSRQAEHLKEIDRFKAKGLVGEDADGKLSIRGEPSKLEKITIQKLLDSENDARSDLYTEAARLNSMDESTLKRNFSESFQKKSPPGTWINKSGQWQKK